MSRITIARRDDLLFQLQQIAGDMEGLIGYLGLLEGGDEAIVAGARSLDEMYPYQHRALNKIHLHGSLANFYGGSPTPSVQQPSDPQDSTR